MTVHVLGVCGTLMGGVACLAVEKGYDVIGYDVSFIPPMSTVLEGKNITIISEYPNIIELKNLDMVIVGNQLRRGHPLIQWLIKKRVKLYSAPEWLLEFVLRDRKVIAVTGSHGKTTITTMISWVLEQCGQQPGYLIGGVSSQLGGCSALGKGPYFVIEADEYDSAFFDKRPKFIHYWPTMLIISNIEYDHADIYPDISSIITQFGYLLRLLPSQSSVISTNITSGLEDMIESFGLEHLQYGGNCGKYGTNLLNNVVLKMPGKFNQENALAAYLAVKAIGIDEKDIKKALSLCKGPARRQMVKYQNQGVVAYDDFAHHPSELLQVVKTFQPKGRLMVLYNPATYTQRQGLMDDKVIDILNKVDKSVILLPKKHNLHLEAYRKAGIILCEDERACALVFLNHVEDDTQIIVTSAYYLEIFWTNLLHGLKAMEVSSKISD